MSSFLIRSGSTLSIASRRYISDGCQAGGERERERQRMRQRKRMVGKDTEPGKRD